MAAVEADLVGERLRLANRGRVVARGQGGRSTIACLQRARDRSLTQKIINYTLVQKLSPTIQTALIPSNAIVNTTSLFGGGAAAGR